MGLSASQFRYLSLTARKSDLEYQAHQINNARLDLATKSADASKAYSDGLNNKLIRISHYENSGDDTKQVWEELTYDNLVKQGYQLIGTGGESLYPSPYTEYQKGAIIDSMTYGKLTGVAQQQCVKIADGTYEVKSYIRSEATPNFKGMDIQSALISGQAHIVTESFFYYLCEHGYGTGSYFNEDGTATTYAKLLDAWNSDPSKMNINTLVDWRSDVSSTFKQSLYEEDDAMVIAEYEAATAEIQQQDKNLELQLKRIETEHKAVETEMEAVQKVIQGNIEKSYKTFSG